jgi:predicted Zn-dependent peptidase
MHSFKTLPNGLKVSSESMNSMESVAIGIWIRAGGRYENRKNSGISHLVEHLLFKGTVSRDMKLIKQEIEGRGGSFNGFTSEEHTCYLVKLLAKDAELGVDILSDMVLRPKLDPSEVTKEKSVIIEEINMYKDMPAHYVHEILAEIMWPDQPLGMPLAGTVESVNSITRDEAASYRMNYYNTRNMLVMGTGRLEESEFSGMAGKYFNAAEPGAESKFSRAVLKQKAPEIIVYKKDTEQTHIALGIHTLDRFHPDKYVLSLVNIILGANMSSRLFHIVRDEMALCYEISSTIRRYEDCGAFVISAGVDNKKLVSALKVILKETCRLKTEPVAKAELDRAKEYYKGQLLFALEDTMSRMLWLGERIISGEKDFKVDDILKRVDSISPDDIMRVAKDTLKNDNLNLAVVGPVKDSKPVREAFNIA